MKSSRKYNKKITENKIRLVGKVKMDKKLKAVLNIGEEKKAENMLSYENIMVY
jgi:hypothetical protein